MTPDPPHRPPRVAEALLALALPPGGIRESVLGDLHEVFQSRCEEPGSGPVRASAWYWSQTARLSVAYGWRRLRGHRFVAFTPVEPTRPVGGDGLSGVFHDLRLSLRSLGRHPSFSVPAFLILAVGMTAATSIFTVVDAIVFEPLDLPESHRLVIVCEDHPRLDGTCIISPGNAEDFRRSTSTLSELGFGRGWSFYLSDAQGSERVRGGLATGGFMRALGVTPAVGRLFSDEEIGPDEDKVVLLSHAIWTTRWGRDASVVGSTVQLDGEPFQVVGVLPANFEVPMGLDGIEVWKPPHIDPLDPEVRGWRGFRAIGRMAEGTAVAAVEAELTGVYAGLADQHDEIDATWRLRVEPLLHEVVGDTRPVLLAFLGGAALLLLIVGANVANLVLARGLQAQREFAVRAALGADRRRLISQIVSESLTLSTLATMAAFLASGGVTRALLALAPPEIPRLSEVSVDLRVLIVAAATAFGLTLLFAVIPALRVTSWNLGQTLKSGGRGGPERGSGRLRSGLVMVEIALSTVLLTSAGLLTRSFQAYTDWDPGFDREPLLAVSAFVDLGKYPTRADFMGVLRRGEEAIAQVPGVLSAATTSAGPLFGGGDGATEYVVEGATESEQLPSVWWFDTGPGYFQTLGVSLTQGREFTEADAAGVDYVAVVNETMARQAWPGRDPLGQVLRLPGIVLEGGALTLTVVGVASDVPPLTPGEVTHPQIYWSNRQLGRPAPFFLIRTRGDPAALAPAITQALLSVDPDLSLGTPRTLTSSEERALVRPRFEALVLLALALAGLALSAIGVYAVISYSVAVRIREMGIRMAIGAGAGQVLKAIIGSSLRVASAGVALGLVGSISLSSFLAGVVHGVSPTDSMTLMLAPVALLTASALASFIPARRATKVDPLVAVSAD